MSRTERCYRDEFSRHQAAIAEFGGSALRMDDLDELLQRATELAAEGLGTGFAKVLEILPSGDRLLIRAGVGWKPGVVGQATLEAGQGSAAGYALLSQAPVITGDIATEHRFKIADLLHQHGIRSMANVVIRGHDGVFGVLEVDSPGVRHFTEDDKNFLTCFANLLAAAIDRNIVTRQLKSTAETKARFLAVASHDLRQPVQAMGLLLDILKKKIAGHPGEEIVDMLALSTETLRQMLSNLLDLSRLEAGSVTPRIVDFVIGDLLERLVEEFRPMAEEAGITLQFLPSSAGVSSDPVLLEIILRNLISNAIKYTPKGRVLVACRRRGALREIQIRDTGPGIPAEHLDEIFEEFRQLDTPGREGQKGIGLGLAIVARTARLLGYKVAVHSEVGKGSMFSVTVPGSETHRTIGNSLNKTTARAYDAEMSRFAGRRIVLVEDDPLILAALGEVLRSWGLDVLTAGSPVELMQRLAAERDPVDLVITDHRLPGGATGADVISIIRRHWPVPAVIMTGDTSAERRKEANAAGWRLMHKPVELDDLRRILEEFLK